MLPVLVGWAWASCAKLYCPTPPLYTATRLNAAWFGAMGVGIVGDAFLCYTPPPRLSAGRLSAKGAGVPLLRCTPCDAVRASAAHFWPILLLLVRALPRSD